MKLRAVIAIIACKFTKFLLRILKKGGTNLPGKIAVKICPSVLGVMARGVTTIIITGTNGKTTTSRMIEQCLVEAGVSFFCNKSGANLLTGITNEFAQNSDIFGRCRKQYAVIECDEAAFRQVSRYVNAKHIIVTNIFRDQVDRFVELETTMSGIRAGIENSPEAIVSINADCSLTTSLVKNVKNRIIYYGVNCPVYEDLVSEVSDAQYCINCNAQYNYEYKTYGHLGSYVCPECGYKRPETEVYVTEVVSGDLDSTTVKLKINNDEKLLRINLPGGYNVYNAISAAAVAKGIGISEDKIITALSSFECGFGRMENFHIGGKNVRMILIKNPAGCNQVLNFLKNTVKEKCLFVTIVNDRISDGTDISWIWDANFEKLEDLGDNLPMIYVGGARADDMANRLKYAGRSIDRIKIIKDDDMLLDEIDKADVDVFIMPTYSAMLSFREKISKRYNLKSYWEN
ncbi:MAG: Mur ligase family protein [Clostridia bacterium]|nr:Mur ligase family protein [Clostridia bacterium]